MTFLAWDESFTIGAPSLDAQHKVLVEALNELSTAVMRGTERNRTGTLLRSFAGYMRNHWVIEERVMADVHSPDMEKHKGLHRHLLQTAEEQLTRFERGEAVNLDSLRVLRDGLTHHIRQVDSDYRLWVEARRSEEAEAKAQPQTSNESCVETKVDAGLVSEARS